MVANNEMKIEILMNSFNVLKNKPDANGEKIAEIISKIAKIDLGLAIEMWEHFINLGTTRTGDGFIEVEHRCRFFGCDFTGMVIHELEENGFEIIKIAENVMDNRVIQNGIYSLSWDICDNTIKLMIALVIKGEFEKVSNIISLINSNKNKKQSFNEILENTSERIFNSGWGMPHSRKDIPKGTAEFILSFIDLVDDEVSKAKIQVNLVDFL